MKILFLSDTHMFHKELKLPPDIEMIIHAGDASNYRSTGVNSNEMTDFLQWYDSIPVQYKILIAGNHDTSVQAKLVDPRKYKTIDYLEHESIEREGINIFGSPYTPSFGVGWAYNVKRGKLDPYWREIPRNTDILVTHGPPKGILDLSVDMSGKLEYCGDKELLNQYYNNPIKPKFHVFGHIHNSEGNLNAGTRTVEGLSTEFINASCVEDGRFDLGLTSHGIIKEF